MSSALLFILLTACGLQLVTSAMLSVVPVLIPENAGAAFSTYSVAKLLFLFFAGKLTTRLGSSRAFTLAILIEAVALVQASFFPEFLLYFRALEGTALALGMVASFTLLREMHSEEAALEKSVAKIMIGSGICVVAGPFIGGIVGDAYPKSFLFGGGILFFILFASVILARPFPFAEKLPFVAGPKKTENAEKSPIDLRLVLALAATHAIGIGLQPLIAYWGKNLFPVSTVGGGITFLAIGVGFFLGVILKPGAISRSMNYLGVLGFVCMEIAVQVQGRNGVPENGEAPFIPPLLPLWLLSVGLIGFWYANRSKRLTAMLGISGEAHQGEDQALWLFWTGIPSALVPIVSWKFRESSESLPRMALELVLIGLSVGVMAIVNRGRKFDRI